MKPLFWNIRLPDSRSVLSLAKRFWGFTVLAYQLVQLVRRRLQESGIVVNGSWRTLRDIMSTQSRVTASFRRADGKALHVRKATQAEPEQMYQYSGMKSKIIKTIFKNLSSRFVIRNIPPAYVYTCNEHQD